MNRVIQPVGALLVGLAVIAGGSTAFASPWTLPADELVITTDQHFEYAHAEYLPDGYYQSFPLDGRFQSQTMRLGARYGFTERFEGSLQLDVSNVTYSADPLILEDFEEAPSSSEATEQILDFNSSQFGASDLRLSGSYNLHRGEVWVTTATRAKVPTGYEQPTGTFHVNEQGETEIGGQATLGDGQADLGQTIMLGTVLRPTGTFIRTEVGGQFRFGDPGHQLLGDLRVGQPVGDALLLVAGATGYHTFVQGEVIGETMIAEDPSVSPAQFTGDNIRAEELRLDSSALNLLGGLLVDLGDVEMTANYYYTVYGQNTAAVHSFTVGTIVALPDVTASDGLF